jgi:hypothetical protein
MQKWEYKWNGHIFEEWEYRRGYGGRENIGGTPVTELGANIVMTTEHLNDIGQEGWELVGNPIFDDHDISDIKTFWKRPIEGEEDTREWSAKENWVQDSK